MGSGKIPMRMCVGCREMRPKRELLRIVRRADGEITADSTGKVNGRGAYICQSPECLKKAKKSGALQRAFGQAVPEEIYEKIETELVRVEQ